MQNGQAVSVRHANLQQMSKFYVIVVVVKFCMQEGDSTKQYQYIPSAIIIISFARRCLQECICTCYKSKKKRTNTMYFLWKLNWFQEQDRSGPISFPFSMCGLNEEKHFQYCTMTALKYDKLLHYIQLYIIRDRPHYTPVGPLQEIILSIIPTTATFSTAGAYVSLWIVCELFQNTTMCEISLAQPSVL